MIADPNAPLDVLERELDDKLRAIAGHEVVHEKGRHWYWGQGNNRCYAILLDDAGPTEHEEGAPKERALELLRPLVDLGYSGALPAAAARLALSSMASAKHVRLARGPHPAGRTHALLAAVTVYLEDLDVEELTAALRELDGFTLPFDGA